MKMTWVHYMTWLSPKAKQSAMDELIWALCDVFVSEIDCMIHTKKVGNNVVVGRKKESEGRRRRSNRHFACCQKSNHTHSHSDTRNIAMWGHQLGIEWILIILILLPNSLWSFISDTDKIVAVQCRFYSIIGFMRSICLNSCPNSGEVKNGTRGTRWDEKWRAKLHATRAEEKKASGSEWMYIIRHCCSHEEQGPDLRYLRQAIRRRRGIFWLQGYWFRFWMLLWTILELRENKQILELREINQVLVVQRRWIIGLSALKMAL